MYDGGNAIFVNDNYEGPITYSTDCAESRHQDAAFRMNINPSGISVSVFDPVPDLGGGAGSVRIEGNLGADGGGAVDYGAFFHFSTGKQYSVFWKQVFGAGDPSVVHLWITDAENPVHDTESSSTDNDRDGLSGVGGATVVYMMWGVQGGRKTTRAQFESVVDTTFFRTANPSWFVCEDGCRIPPHGVNDNYCDCSGCEDEDDWSCGTCAASGSEPGAGTGSTCLTATHGWEQREVPCVFPFVYHGNTYFACTTDDHSAAWCATTSNYDNDGEWGECSHGCSADRPEDPAPESGSGSSCSHSYALLGNGYCDDGTVYLPEGDFTHLNPGDRLYHPDKTTECMQRCLDSAGESPYGTLNGGCRPSFAAFAAATAVATASCIAAELQCCRVVELQSCRVAE